MRMHALPQNRLSHSIQQLVSSSDKLKTAQYIGTGAVQFILSSNVGGYDWSGVLPAAISGGPAVGDQALLVTAATTTMNFAVGDLIIQLFVGSPSNLYTYGNFLADRAASIQPFSAVAYSLAGPASSPNISTWKIFVSGDRTTTCYIKVYLVANDSMTLTVVPTTTL